MLRLKKLERENTGLMFCPCPEPRCSGRAGKRSNGDLKWELGKPDGQEARLKLTMISRRTPYTSSGGTGKGRFW